jgi:hypothetical protein
MLAIQKHQFDKALAKAAPKPYSPHGDNTLVWEIKKLLEDKWIWWFWEGGVGDVLGGVLWESRTINK